jgi:hypothetical protein
MMIAIYLLEDDLADLIPYSMENSEEEAVVQ